MAKGKDAPLPRCACPPPRQHRACDPRPGRTLGTPVPGFPRRAAASLRVPGALSLRARARAQGARCKYRAARWGALLRYPTALRGQHSRLHCAPISPAAGRTCPALHCGTDRRRASAVAISTARPAACLPFLSKPRRCGGAGNRRIKHDRGFCRVHELFALSRLAFVRSYGA